MQYDEIIIDSNGLELAAKMWGPEGGEPILALHGWMDNANSFDLLAPLLGDYRICALDLAGHGRSEHRPLGNHYYVTDYVADAVGAVNALGWDEFTLLGHSLGANVSTLIAGTIPERIKKAIFIEGFGPPSRAAHQGPEQLRQAITKNQIFNPDRTIFYDDFNTLVQKRMNGGTVVNEQAARILCERGAKQVEGGWTWCTDPRLRHPSPMRLPEAEIIKFIQNISASSCLIIGENGLPLQLMGLDERIKHHTALRVEKTPGKHHLHLEGEADVVAQIILTFLRASD